MCAGRHKSRRCERGVYRQWKLVTIYDLPLSFAAEHCPDLLCIRSLWATMVRMHNMRPLETNSLFLIPALFLPASIAAFKNYKKTVAHALNGYCINLWSPEGWSTQTGLFNFNFTQKMGSTKSMVVCHFTDLVEATLHWSGLLGDMYPSVNVSVYTEARGGWGHAPPGIFF